MLSLHIKFINFMISGAHNPGNLEYVEYLRLQLQRTETDKSTYETKNPTSSLPIYGIARVRSTEFGKVQGSIKIPHCLCKFNPILHVR